MKLKTFLTHCIKNKPPINHIVYFVVEEYPALFFSLFLKRYKQDNSALTTLGWDEIEKSSLEARLNTTFLGASEIIWCGDISGLESSTRDWFLKFLTTYRGPHTILCAVQQKDLSQESKADLVECYEELQKSDIEALFAYFWPMGKAEYFLSTLGSHFKTLSLDTVVLLGVYTLVLGPKTEEFMRSWFQKIVLPEESLFSLSQFLFARKKDHFFRVWLSVKDDHVAPFWTTFWSEQLWRAYHVIEMRKKEQFAAAKQMSMRLPFSFLQRDWKTISCKELQKAHDFLYKIDCHVKSGGSDMGLEIFFDDFMSKRF